MCVCVCVYVCVCVGEWGEGAYERMHVFATSGCSASLDVRSFKTAGSSEILKLANSSAHSSRIKLMWWCVCQQPTRNTHATSTKENIEKETTEQDTMLER